MTADSVTAAGACVVTVEPDGVRRVYNADAGLLGYYRAEAGAWLAFTARGTEMLRTETDARHHVTDTTNGAA